MKGGLPLVMLSVGRTIRWAGGVEKYIEQLTAVQPEHRFHEMAQWVVTDRGQQCNHTGQPTLRHT